MINIMKIDLVITAPEFTKSYTSIEVRRIAGGVAPNANCTADGDLRIYP